MVMLVPAAGDNVLAPVILKATPAFGLKVNTGAPAVALHLTDKVPPLYGDAGGIKLTLAPADSDIA